ncbi:MAG: hypothetical protein V3V62_05610, partial [bacterium]
VLAHAFWFAPQIQALGRALDFADRAREAGTLRTFGLYHGAYVLTDFAKAGLLLASLWLLARKGAGDAG